MAPEVLEADSSFVKRRERTGMTQKEVPLRDLLSCAKSKQDGGGMARRDNRTRDNKRWAEKKAEMRHKAM